MQLSPRDFCLLNPFPLKAGQPTPLGLLLLKAPLWEVPICSDMSKELTEMTVPVSGTGKGQNNLGNNF